MDTRRTPRSTAKSQSPVEKPKGKRPAEEKTAEEVGIGRRTRSKGAQPDDGSGELVKPILNQSGLEESEDESSEESEESEVEEIPQRRSLRSRKSENEAEKDKEPYSADNIGNSDAGGQPGRYKCSDCAKSFAFAGSFFMHRREHLKCKKCDGQFQTAAGLSDHQISCQGASSEPSRKRRRSSNVTTDSDGTVEQSGNGGRRGGSENLSCGETLGDSPEPILDDNTQTIGFAAGSEPPAMPPMEGHIGGAEQQPFSGTDTPPIQSDHQPHPLAAGSSRGKGKASGDTSEVMEVGRVSNKKPTATGGEKSVAKKSFVCAHCGLSFRTKDGLAVHVEQHESGELEGFVDPEKQAACTLCEQSFNTPDELDEHLVSTHHIKLNESGLGHSGSTPNKKGFKCAYCDTLVEGKHELNTHVKKVHFGFKYYSCPMCSKSLRDANSLNFHIKWVHMAEKFDCPLCPRAFRSEEGLRNHLVGNHTKTFDPRLFGLEVTDDREPKLRRRGMRSVPIIRRRKHTAPGTSAAPSLAVGTAMTNQADIIAPINAEFGVQEEVICPDGTPGSEMESRFYPRCDASGLPLKGSGLINGKKYKFIRTVGNTKLFYDKKGEIIGTEQDAVAARGGESPSESPTPSNEAAAEATPGPYKEEKLKISTVNIKIMSF